MIDPRAKAHLSVSVSPVTKTPLIWSTQAYSRPTHPFACTYPECPFAADALRHMAPPRHQRPSPTKMRGPARARAFYGFADDAATLTHP